MYPCTISYTHIYTHESYTTYSVSHKASDYYHLFTDLRSVDLPVRGRVFIRMEQAPFNTT